MGNTDSEIQNEQQLLSSYQLISTEDDRRFGDIAIYKNRRTHTLVWIKEVILENESAIEHFKTYSKAPSTNNEMFLTLNSQLVGQRSHFCGACSNSHKLVVVMEYFERDLEGEIMRRAEDMDFFPEAEIWYILEAVMMVEKHMLSYKRVHGDIRSAGIFISEEGEFFFIFLAFFEFVGFF
jgi:hypothetical protein